MYHQYSLLDIHVNENKYFRQFNDQIFSKCAETWLEAVFVE